MRNPEADVVDAIAALVDEQLEQESSGYDHNINQDTCPRCGNGWHGLATSGCPGATGLKASPVTDTDRRPGDVYASHYDGEQLRTFGGFGIRADPSVPRGRLRFDGPAQSFEPPHLLDDRPLPTYFRLVIAELVPAEYRAVEPPEVCRLYPSHHRVVDIRCESSYSHATDMLWLRIRVDEQYLTHIVPCEAVYAAPRAVRLLHTSIPNLADSYVELFTHPTYGVVALFRIKDGAFHLHLRFTGLGHR
ncbi:Uncharacterised protein [Mycobacteroides abscessus subsp. abscessus]|uniref:hypothetical protein n=1 Tax=Mycobacteroides abscessus TaxID=36809 RepID=UPI0009D18772|nr:hypothetical protein [Mycobacteroides abscessus]SLJ40364.1 Uncharacterised protein [Mycobacteroides abscessus subsp. abscessus]